MYRSGLTLERKLETNSLDAFPPYPLLVGPADWGVAPYPTWSYHLADAGPRTAFSGRQPAQREGMVAPDGRHPEQRRRSDEDHPLVFGCSRTVCCYRVQRRLSRTCGGRRSDDRHLSGYALARARCVGAAPASDDLLSAPSRTVTRSHPGELMIVSPTPSRRVAGPASRCFGAAYTPTVIRRASSIDRLTGACRTTPLGL